MASAACANAPAATIQSYVRGALTLGAVTLAELREAALHLAVYAGWSRGQILDEAVTAIATELNLPPAPIPPICPAPWDPQQRLADGAVNFKEVMIFSGPPAQTAYFEAGILNFVFGEIWMRPGLDQRSRRWITLTGVAESASTIPIRTHAYAAMASFNATPSEMYEFVLQYAIHCGWPRASVMQSTIIEMAKRIEQNLPFEA
jgi:4-carboxymuconolactone decarboxylase